MGALIFMDIQRIKEIHRENLELMERKNRDYSGDTGDNISATGMVGMATRIMDKASRFNNLINTKGAINFESVKDTLDDLMNYALIARLLEEGSWASKPNLIYLAGAIDDVTGLEARGWRREITEKLAIHKKINVFNPVTAYNIVDLDVAKKAIVEIDRMAIAQCDIIIAYLAGEGRSFGTIREVEFAKSLGKRVILISEYIPSAFAIDCEQVETINQAVDLF